MPTKCFFKNCKSISTKHTDKVFVPFVKPKSDIKRCIRWLQLSGRIPFSIDRISRNTYLCNDHFPPDEVLDWRKNAKLDPIPLHRLKKVATAEVVRVINLDPPNPKSNPGMVPNVESEDNWVDETDWSDDDDKPNIAEKGRRNYSRNYKRAADIKQISDNLHPPNPNSNPGIVPHVESEDNWVDETDWSDVESGDDDDKPNNVKKGRRNYSRNYKRAADIKQIKDNLHPPNSNPGIVSNVESEDNWVDKTVWSDVESGGDDDKPNLAEKGRKNYSRNFKRAADIKQIRDSIPDENLRKKLDDILSNK